MADPLGFEPDPPGFEPDAPASLGRRASQALGAGHQYVANLLRSVDTLGGRLPGSPSGSFITPEMANPVPRNLTEAGAQLAQMAVPGGNAPLRIGAQALGGEAGSRLEGGEPWVGGAKSGANALIGEIIGGVTGKLARSAPGAKGFIAGQDAAAYGGEMGRQSPPLKGASTVQDLQRLAQGEGRTALGGAKEGIIQRIEALTGNAPLSVPSIGPNNMTLRQANDALSEIGARAFSKNPLDRTFNGIDQRQLYGRIANELDAALAATHPDAAPLFRQAQADYAKGLALLRPLQAGNAYRYAPNDVQFNTPIIQKMLQNPKNAAALRNKLGDQGYQALLDTMTRGAGQGQDVLPSGSGRMADALMQSFGRGQNTGAAQYLGVPLRTLLPNIGGQYTGRQPLSLPPAVQQLVDLILQRKLAGIENPPLQDQKAP